MLMSCRRKRFTQLLNIPHTQCDQYREMEHLHRGDGAEKGSRLPVAIDR